MKPTRVLHLTPPGFGGIDAYIFSHYRYMDQDRFCFEFLTRNTELETAEQYRSFSYKVWPLPETAAQNRDGFTKNVREILKNGYDVLHLHTSYWTGFLMEEIAKDIGIKKVIVHSHSTFVDEEDPRKRQKLVERHEEIKRVFSPDLATDYWACSWKAAGWLFGEQIPRKNIRIMKNAIEVERFRFNPKVREKIRAELGLENAPVLGTTGRLAYQKNHSFLIEVFGKFQKKCENTKLIIIGDGELQEDLKNQIQKSGLENAVLLLGWKPNVEDYLQAMDCFLLPSRFEGNPISLIEAVASGLPALIADTITQEAVISDTIHQIPLDVPAWLSALEEILCDLVDRRNGIEVVRAAGYDIRQQAKVLERLYTM